MIAAAVRARVSAWLVLGALVCSAPVAASAQAINDRQTLADALTALQAQGLRIVFSSELVSPALRVLGQPRSKQPRQILDELLAPHGLAVEEGPGRILQIVRASPPTKPAPRRDVAPPPRPRTDDAPGAYEERVMVTAPVLEMPRSGAGPAFTLQRHDLTIVKDVLADDPLRAAQSLPRAAAADDFRSELSVRGSPYRHVGVAIDGVLTPWLRHAAYGRRDAGSVAMLSSDVLEEVTLVAGAYPQRFGDRLGAQVGLTLRQGSRMDTRWGGTVSGTNATIVAEGPIGGAQRGSWLIAARQSFLDWPVRRRNALNDTVFGFSDVQSKLVYDVRPDQRISVTFVGGRSGVDGPDEPLPTELVNGGNRAGFLKVGWRAVRPNLILDQHAHVVVQQYRNKLASGEDGTRGENAELSYRAAMLRHVPGGLLEAGAQVQRVRESLDALAGAAWLRSAFANFVWTPAPRVTIAPGLRVTHATALGRTAAARWIVGEFALLPSLSLTGSTGVSYQIPEPIVALRAANRSGLVPERAVHADLGLAHRLGHGFRWQASLFDRRERDVLRAPQPGEPVTNGVTGDARGLELLLERRSATGLSGWAAYSYGLSRQTDVERSEHFWSDFDQRHALNLSARYAPSDRMTVAVTFRSGSNFPLPGYFAERDGRLYVGDVRNAIRLPLYARLDVRAQKTFTRGTRRFTIFGEVLNVLDRTNVGSAQGFYRPGTGEAVGFTETLFPRLPSAGLRIEF